MEHQDQSIDPTPRGYIQGGVRILVLSLLLSGLAASAGCTDPCVALAQRICECEPSPALRQACETERIQPLQEQLEPTAEEQQRCLEALDTCTCEALAENRVEQCAFTREAE
jgi:hypothetical protein